MDPDTTLRLIAEFLKDRKYKQSRQARTDLINWLSRGGFAPEWDRYPEATSYVFRVAFWYFPSR